MGSISNDSLFESLSEIPLDPHYALKELYRSDTDPRKVILGSGLYRDDNSKPWVLSSVQRAEALVKETQGSDRYEYLPIQGYAPFVSAARQVLTGPSTLDQSRVVSLQTVSGTGANSLGARFLAETLKPSAVWLSDPSWVNHANIWSLAGVDVKRYPYWNAATKNLDFNNMIDTLETRTSPGDVILLHACAHNPTGVDPTKEQWKLVADVCERKRLFPFFDCAYLGFASGDLDEDAWAVRHFLGHGKFEMAVAQSFSKNMGLYGERVGALHLFCGSQTSAAKAKGHLSRFQRGSVSQPPVSGSRLAATILSDPALYENWLADLQEMSGRIKGMRNALRDELVALGTPGQWDHIASQIGMFSYTGLTPEQVAFVQDTYHVYILKSGRISIAGLNTKNVKHVANGIDEAVRECPDAAHGCGQAPMAEAHHLETGSPRQALNAAATGDPDPHQLDDQTQRLPFSRLIAAYVCLCLCYFISYLDMNSVTTSTAVISDALEAGPSITWVGTAYLLGQTSCQPLYGRVSDIIGRKPVLLFSVGCVTIGGLLCGFAQSPQWLYVCRAISGIGGGGISSSVAIIVSDLVSLKSRGKYQGMISLAIGIGAATGPFVAAGLIATGPDGWRWAFRVPSIAAAGCCCLLIFLLPQRQVYGDWRAKVGKVDWLGVVTSVAGLVLLLMPINSGGSLWSWSNAKTISTLTIGAVLLIAFVAVEAYMARIPIIPLQLFRRRSPAILFITGILHDFVWQTTQYFVPLYFQTVRGYTPLESATLILPFLLAQGLAGAASGPVMAKLARYAPVLRIGFLLWTLGTGLKLLFNQGTSTAVSVVILAIEGAGVGWVHQPGLVALQANSRDQDRAVATSTRNVLRSLGGVLGVAVSTAAYYAVLDRGLRGMVPDSLRTQVLSGTWRLGDKTTEIYQSAILDGRMNGFKVVFAVLVPLMGLCLLAVFFVDDLELQGDAKPVPQPKPPREKVQG